MEANRVEALSAAMEEGESNHREVFDVGFDNIDNFDYLMELDYPQFDMYNLSVLPSLHMPSPPVPTIEIDDVAKLAVIDSISQEEMISMGSIVRSEDSTLGHARSLYVDSNLIANVDDGKKSSGKRAVESNMDSRHQINDFVNVSRSPLLVARAMPPEKLVELARTDPKKANRILANRKSAAKSKERRKIYENELENRVKSLRAGVDNVAEQLSLTERDITTRSAWNDRLRKQIEAKQQELQHIRAPYEAMRKELEYYRMKTTQFATDMANNNPSYCEPVSNFSTSGLAMQHGCDPNPPSQHQAPLVPSSLCWSPLPFGQPLDEQCGLDFSNFNMFD